MELVPVEELKVLKEVDVEQLRERGMQEEDLKQLHYFSCIENENGLLDITVHGITLSMGYSKIQFYKSAPQGISGIVAAKGIRPDGKCEFVTEYLSDVIKGFDEVKFFEGLNGNVIPVATREDITMDFEHDIVPSHIVEGRGKIKLYTCDANINGKTMKALVTSVRYDDNSKEYYMNGVRIKNPRRKEKAPEEVKKGVGRE